MKAPEPGPEQEADLKQLARAVSKFFGIPTKLDEIEGFRYDIGKPGDERIRVVSSETESLKLLLLPDRANGHLDLVYIDVSEDLRGQGFGSAMIDQLRVLARKLGYRSLYMWADNKDFWAKYTGKKKPAGDKQWLLSVPAALRAAAAVLMGEHFKTTDDMLKWALEQRKKHPKGDVPAPEVSTKQNTTDSEIPETFGRVFCDEAEDHDLDYGEHDVHELDAPPDFDDVAKDDYNYQGDEHCQHYDDARDVCLDKVAASVPKSVQAVLKKALKLMKAGKDDWVYMVPDALKPLSKEDRKAAMDEWDSMVHEWQRTR